MVDIELNETSDNKVTAVTNGDLSKGDSLSKSEDVQDETPYTVKIIPTHSDPFELQVISTNKISLLLR